MRKSRCVTLTILAAFAASACDDSVGDVKHCVDENGVVQAEALCDPPDGGDSDASVQTPVYDEHGVVTHYVYVPRTHFHWYYMSGGGSRIYSPGSRVSGGSYTPSVGRSYSPPSSISRGGFGGTGHGFGGGSGE